MKPEKKPDSVKIFELEEKVYMLERENAKLKGIIQNFKDALYILQEVGCSE